VVYFAELSVCVTVSFKLDDDATGW